MRAAVAAEQGRDGGHHQHADEARDDRRGAVHADFLMQQEDRQQRDEQGPRETQRVELGQRQAEHRPDGDQAEHEARRADQAARDKGAEAGRVQLDHAEEDEGRGQQEGKEAAPEGEEDGVDVGGDFLGEGQVQRVAHARDDHPERALKIARERRAPY